MKRNYGPTLLKGCLSLALLTLGTANAQNSDSAVNPSKKTTGSAPAVNKTVEVGLPMYVGYEVVTQVDDLRETVGDLIESLDNAADYGYVDKKTIANLRARITEVDRNLDVRDHMVDEQHWGIYRTTAYGTTIHSSVRHISDILQTISKGMTGEAKSRKLPLRVADDVVDQVDDVRDATGDLITAIQSAGESFSYYNWARDKPNLVKYEAQLKTIESTLETKKDIADEEWTAWFGADVTKVRVHDSVAQLGSILNGLADSLSGQPQKASH